MEPEEVLEQEVVETPVEEPEVVQEEPQVEQEPVEEESPAENVQPDTESGQENVQEPAPEPARWNISTGGNWEPLENYLTEQLEVGKTYHIKVQGKCEFMIAKDKPTAGIATNEITFTKQNDVTIWIKTGV